MEYVATLSGTGNFEVSRVDDEGFLRNTTVIPLTTWNANALLESHGWYVTGQWESGEESAVYWVSIKPFLSVALVGEMSPEDVRDKAIAIGLPVIGFLGVLKVNEDGTRIIALETATDPKGWTWSPEPSILEKIGAA